MVPNICSWDILLGFWCYHSAWCSKFMEFSAPGEHSLCCISDWWVVPN
uniref:Uncharacterized protein n=1 Tax=Arundo donax TaxID=35708 RepID=A0A0A9EA27_ARUDO